MTTSPRKWRSFLKAHGFRVHSVISDMWMYGNGFYIRRTVKSDKEHESWFPLAKFASCTGEMDASGKFYLTVEDALAGYVAYLLTKESVRPE